MRADRSAHDPHDLHRVRTPGPLSTADCARRRWLLAAPVLLLGACASAFGPRTLEVSQARLQERVDSRFPVSRRWLELFDVTVASPQLTLRPEANRIATRLALSARDRLTRTPLNGTLELDCSLRFEPADNTIRLAGVRVERFELHDVPGALQTPLARLGRVLAEEMLDGQVVHTLKAEDMQRAQGRGFRPGEIKVTSRGLSLTLEPIE